MRRIRYIEGILSCGRGIVGRAYEWRDEHGGIVRGGCVNPLWVLALLVALGASGCGASALRQHATIATVASVAVASAAPAVPVACDAALTGCHGEPACVTETAERCRVAARATDGLVAAVRGYVDAVEVASYADEGSVLPALLAAWGGLVRLWPTVVAVLAAIGVTVPALPTVTP